MSSSSKQKKNIKKTVLKKLEPMPDISTKLEEVNHGIEPEMLQIIKNALHNENEVKALEIFDDFHYTDQAILFTLLKTEYKDRMMLYVLNYEFNPYFLTELNNDLKAQFIHFFGYKKIATLLNTLANDEIIYFLSCLGIGDQIKLLKRFPHENRKGIRTGLSYPDRAAGRIMDLDYPVVTQGMTIDSVLEYIRNNTENLPDKIYDIFVVNDDHQLIGIASLMSIVKSNSKAKIDTIINREVSTINAMDDKSEVLYLFNKYDLDSAPVLDSDGHLVGIISVDNVKYLATEEADESMRMQGVLSDLDEGIFQTTKVRFIWLFVNLITSALASYVISFFEHTIHAITALAVLMPVSLSMGSNGGMQTIAVIIRAIATKDLNANTFNKYFSREILMSFMNGVVISCISSLVVYLVYRQIGLALVFGFGIFAAMIIAALTGVFAPIIMRKLGTDPAVTAVVFLMTVVEIGSFVIFLGMAKLFLL